MPFARRAATPLILAALGACAPPRAPAVIEAPAAPPPTGPVAPEPAGAPASKPAPTSAPAPPHWPPAPPGIKTSFCLEGVVEALAEDACYILPDRPARALLIYLPGLMPPSAESPEKRMVETVVANAARRAGVAALIPRGPSRAELAAPGRDEKGLGAYRSWPTGDDAYRRHARQIVARIEDARRALEALAGAPFDEVFLGGSSAGAYFVAHLALRGELAAQGYAVISGGSARPATLPQGAYRAPFYVGYGDGDIVGAKAEEAARAARAAGFPVRVSVHHTGHGSREFYLDEALAFFTSAAKGAPESIPR